MVSLRIANSILRLHYRWQTALTRRLSVAVTHQEYRDGVGPSPNGGGAESARPPLNPPVACELNDYRGRVEITYVSYLTTVTVNGYGVVVQNATVGSRDHSRATVHWWFLTARRRLLRLDDQLVCWVHLAVFARWTLVTEQAGKAHRCSAQLPNFTLVVTHYSFSCTDRNCLRRFC